METPMKNILKAVLLIATTMTIVIALTSTIRVTSYDQRIRQAGVSKESYSNLLSESLIPSKRVSRFLSETDEFYQRRSLKPADHCHKDNDVCDVKYGANSTCCGNKCFDLSKEKNYCGSCKIKCKYTYSCCNGRCVDLAYDKRHCGMCNNKCMNGQYCIYGMCDYA